MPTPARRYRTQRPCCKRCINCSILLAPNLRRHTVEELNELMRVLLRIWALPTSIASDDIICIECYLLLQERSLSNVTNSHEDMAPAYGHLNICFGCGISIASRRTHTVQLDCPQRSSILRWTPAHLVAHLKRVCIACWLAATRESQRSMVYDQNREPDDIKENPTPALKTERLDPPPMPTLTHHTLVPQSRIVHKVTSQKYKRVAAASRHCIFIGCRYSERLLVPMTVRELLLLQHKIYIPMCTRICNYHLNNNQWDELTAKLNDFTGSQMDHIFSILEKASEKRVPFVAK